MTKDYAKPSTTRKTGSAAKRKSSQKPPAKKSAPKKKGGRQPAVETPKGQSKYIVLILLVLGGFGYTLFKLAQVPQATAPRQTEKVTPKTKTTEASTPRPAKKEKPQTETEARFQFYDLLPNSEVDTNSVDAYTFKEKGQSEQYRYVVQTGSFRSQKDAEKQRATIAFQGLKGRINKVSSASGSVWYRVETGPFESRSAMNAALDKLVAINIQPLVKKQKK